LLELRMQKNHSHGFIALAYLIIASTRVHAQEPQLGLILTPSDRLAGIPLASTPFSGTELPPSVDLSDKFPPPGNQGQQRSCVAWTIAYALKSYQEYVEERQPLRDASGKPNLGRVFSPAFIYNQINQGRDGGSLFIDALNVLSSQGAAMWHEMPYRESDYLSQPPANVRDSAKRYRIDYWRRVNAQDLREVKAQLNAGYPVMIGFMVDDGLLQLRRGAIWSSASGAQRGAHAMLVVGYDDARAAFKFINSWGTEWADDGYGWMGYGLFPQVVREAFVAKDAINGSPVVEGPRSPPVDRAAATSFQVTGVQHNVTIPGYGLSTNFVGTVSVPAGVTGILQIVIHVYANNGQNGKGPPVGSLVSQFSTVNGTAATATVRVSIPPGGLNTTWQAVLPYSALNVPKGMVITPTGPQGTPITSYLVAEPTLFIDNFGIRAFSIIPFSVGL
jgi:hypothetical protein